MDPNLFHLDWERTIEALVAIIVLAFFVERACSLIFESRWYIRLFEDPRVGKPPAAPPSVPTPAVASAPATTTSVPGAPAPVSAPAPATAQDQAARDQVPLGRRFPVKELVAFALAAGVCLAWDFDALSMVLLRDQTHILGKLLTAAVIAGGSKASVRLFQDLLGVRSNAEAERQDLKKPKPEGGQ